MASEFYDAYTHYPTIDLLKIVRRPDDYQPLAVAVAAQILRERDVAAEEISALDHTLQAQSDAERFKAEKIKRMATAAVELFPPLSQPHEHVEPAKWINLLLLVIGLQYARILFESVKSFVRSIQREYFPWFYYINFISLVYIPVIFYLLLKKRRWGWILLFADNLFTLILLLSQSYIFFKYQSIHHGSIVWFVTPILIRSAFAFFLWRDAITEHFSVTKTIRNRTAMIVAVGTLLYMGALYVIYS